MTRREYAGGAAATTLAASITASDLTISLASGGGSDWPTGTSDPFIIAIDRGTGDEEKILVLSRTGDTLTVAAPGNRGFDDTTATSHSVGAAVDHVLGAIDIDEPNAHINNTVLDHHTQYLTSDRHLAISHTTAMYAADSVDNAALGPDAVSDAELQDDAVGSEHIQTDAVGADEIGAAVITEPKYAAGSVSLRAMGADSVDGDKIADDSIDSEHYVNFSVDQDHLSDNAKVHPGMMVVWSGTTEPSSWFFCYGQEKSRIAQANL
ncbi:MAG: hypothetical protein GY925_17785, partial [Actinomycetia bacterium]|nr:hypothetical protein [Actinomycetes bacterium]